MSEPTTLGTAVKTVPPVVAGVWQLFGHSLPENVSAITFVWIALLITEKLCRWGYAAWTRRK